MAFRPEPRARTPHEHMVHQCMSEDAWMTKMLGIASGLPVLPAEETKLVFLSHYAAASAARLSALETMDDAWFEGATQFFDTVRSRAWVLTRRLTHSAHHRGQLTVYLRLWGEALYSTYGPTADTGDSRPMAQRSFTGTARSRNCSKRKGYAVVERRSSTRSGG